MPPPRRHSQPVYPREYEQRGQTPQQYHQRDDQFENDEYVQRGDDYAEHQTHIDYAEPPLRAPPQQPGPFSRTPVPQRRTPVQRVPTAPPRSYAQPLQTIAEQDTGGTGLDRPGALPVSGPLPHHHQAIMPVRSQTNAPKLGDGQGDIVRFLRDVRILANNAGLEDQSAINWARHYAGKEADVWEDLPEIFGNDWDAFTAAVLVFYPDADPIPRIEDLQQLSSRQFRAGMRDVAELGVYSREFKTLSAKLLRHGAVSTAQCDDLYLKGLPKDIQKQVQSFAVMQRGRPTALPPTMAETNDIASDILRTGKLFNFGGTVLFSDYEPKSKDSSSATTTASSDLPAIATALSQLATNQTDIAREINNLRRNNQPRNANPPPVQASQPAPPQTQQPAPATRAPAAAPQPSGQQRLRYDCLVCGQPSHRAQSCPHREELIKRGYATQDGRYLRLSNGELLPGPNDETLIRRINTALARNPNLIPPGQPASYEIDPAPKAAATIFEGVYPAVPVVAPWTSDHSSSPVPEAEAAPSHIHPDRAAAMVMRTRKWIGQPPPDLTKKTPTPEPDESEPDDQESSRNATRPPSPAATELSERIPVDPPLPSDASSIGDDEPPIPPSPVLRATNKRAAVAKDLDGLEERLLNDTKVQLTLGELLRFSPSIRKALRLQPGPKPAKARPSAANIAQVLYTAGPRPSSPQRTTTAEEPIASPNEPLREIDLLLDGKIKARGLVDSGATLIAMHKDVWISLGSPILEESRIVVESAHGTTAETLGLLPRLRINIGGFSVLVQAHVVFDGPFEILLGRPFFRHCCGSIVDTPDTNFLRLHEPLTHERIAVPTIARVPPLAGISSFIAHD